jgi:MoaA/NifB/PqqE/SkfB family radical SAM enzyme
MPTAWLRTKLRKARSLGLAKVSLLAQDKLKRKLCRKLHLLPRVPRAVFVELTNQCNLRCIFCDRGGLTRKSGMMSMGLFKQVIRNAAEIGVPSVKLSRFGEPVLHPDLPDMIRYCKRRRIPRVHLASNATLLTEGMSRQLILSGLDMIAFSVDGATKETFERMRVNASYEQVRENILRFVWLRNSMKSLTPWIAISTGLSRDTVREIPDVLATWSPCVDEVLVHPVVKYGNVGDLSPIRREAKVTRRRACPSLSERLVIFWDGTATVCCPDINGDLAVGNVSESRIEHLWKSDRFSEIRRKHARLDFSTLPICTKCDHSDAVHNQRMKALIGLVKRKARRAEYPL